MSRAPQAKGLKVSQLARHYAHQVSALRKVIREARRRRGPQAKDKETWPKRAIRVTTKRLVREFAEGRSVLALARRYKTTVRTIEARLRSRQRGEA